MLQCSQTLYHYSAISNFYLTQEKNEELVFWEEILRSLS